MGSTGDPPVPSGHWPNGTGRRLALVTDARKSSGAVRIPSGGSPLGTGQWPVLPEGLATAISEFGLNRKDLGDPFDVHIHDVRKLLRGNLPQRRTSIHQGGIVQQKIGRAVFLFFSRGD